MIWRKVPWLVRAVETVKGEYGEGIQEKKGRRKKIMFKF